MIGKQRAAIRLVIGWWGCYDYMAGGLARQSVAKAGLVHRPLKADAFKRVRLNAQSAFGGVTRFHMFYVYVLNCWLDKRQTFYTGYTENLKSRLKQHVSGSTTTTRKFDKIELIYYEACLNENDARQREIQLKTGYGRGYLNRRLENYLKKQRD